MMILLWCFRHSKQKVIYEGPHPITGLAFRNVGKSQIVFACTEHHTMALDISVKQKDQKVMQYKQRSVTSMVYLQSSIGNGTGTNNFHSIIQKFSHLTRSGLGLGP